MVSVGDSMGEKGWFTSDSLGSPVLWGGTESTSAAAAEVGMLWTAGDEQPDSRGILKLTEPLITRSANIYGVPMTVSHSTSIITFQPYFSQYYKAKLYQRSRHRMSAEIVLVFTGIMPENPHCPEAQSKRNGNVKRQFSGDIKRNGAKKKRERKTREKKTT